MELQLIADKIELTELANKLFMYCDAKQWDKMMEEVFLPVIWFDASSAGAGEPTQMEAQAVCYMWDKGFEGIDAIHHQAGHYLIDVKNDQADIYAYAVATHYKREAVKGNTRIFVGSYDLKAERKATGWRLSQFKYNVKYIDGNIALQ